MPSAGLTQALFNEKDWTDGLRLIVTAVWRFPSLGFFTPFSTYIHHICSRFQDTIPRMKGDSRETNTLGPLTPSPFVRLGDQLMIRFGFPDLRPSTLAPEGATFSGTFDSITGVVFIAHLTADDRLIQCIPPHVASPRPTDLS
jgi:hypothetical protein